MNSALAGHVRIHWTCPALSLYVEDERELEMELTPAEYDDAVLREMKAQNKDTADRKLAMRAREEDYDDYAERYQERANEDMNGDADWELFEQLWADRFNSNDDMAELLAEVLGMAHDEALAWVEGRDTP